MNAICGRFFICLAMGVLLLIGNTVFAGVENIGLRYGRTFRGVDLDQYDVFMSFALPWSSDSKSGWDIKTDLELALSALDGEGTTAFKPSLAGNVVFISPGGRLNLRAGIGAGLISETEFGVHDLGGTLFFLGQLGLRFQLMKNFFIGYRYLHQSNAGIYDSNDSLNVNQIELVWHF